MTFTKNDIRAFKLSKVLHDTCLSIVQNYITNEITIYHTSLKRFLESSKVDFEDSSKSPHFYFDEIAFIYPNGVAVENASFFDISLCCKIYRYFCKKNHIGYEQTPIRVIHDIRDKNYAHVLMAGIKYEKFNNLINNLTKSLDDMMKKIYSKQNQNAVNQKIKSILESSIEDHLIKKNKDEILKMMANDHEFNEIFANGLKEISDGSEQLKTCIKQLTVAVNDNKNNKNAKTIEQKLICLFNLTKNETEKTNNSINQAFQELEKNLKTQNQAMVSTLVSTFQTTQNQTKTEIIINQNESKTEIINSFQSGVSELKNLMIKDNNNFKAAVKNPIPEISLIDFKSYFFCEEFFPAANFKILILDIDRFYWEKFDNELFESFGFNDWNIIVDINSHPSINQALQQQLECDGKNFTIFNFSNSENFNDQLQEPEINCIQNGVHKCYFKFSSQNENQQDDNFLDFQKFRRQFDQFLKKVVTGKHSIMCTNLFVKECNDSNYYMHIEKLNENISTILNDSNSSESLKLVYLILNDLQYEFPDDVVKIFNQKIIQVNKNVCFTTIAQFLTEMNLTKKNNQGDYYLPGNAGDVKWQKKLSSMYSAYFEVYHKKIGEKNFSESEIKKKAIDYIMGYEIDAETIYVNDDFETDGVEKKRFKTYIQTQEMEITLKEIKQGSKKEKFYWQNNVIKSITCPAYSGGTTIGRALLYKLRKELPCIRVLYYDNGNYMIEGLKKISDDSNLPLVVLIDTDAIHENGKCFTYADVENFSTELSVRNTIRHYIIFIDRSLKFNIELCREVQDEYEEFYNYYLPKRSVQENEYEIMTNNLIIIRLLYSQRNKEGNLQKIKEISKTFSEKFTDNDKTLLIIMYIFENFTENLQLFDADFVAFVLKISHLKQGLHVLCKEKSLKPTVLDILKCKKSTKALTGECIRMSGFKLLNRELSESIVELICEQENKNKLEYFFDLFQNICSDILEYYQSNKHLMKALLDLVETIFKIKGINEYADDDKQSECNDCKPSFSNIIESCSNQLGIEKTEKILSSFYNIFTKIKDIAPKIGMVYARFLFFKYEDSIEKKDQSIKLMKQVFNVNDSLLNTNLEENMRQPHLLCAYGDLLRHYICENLKNRYSNTDRQTFDHIKALTEECIRAYRMSNSENINNANTTTHVSNRYNKNPLSLIGECKIRKRFMLYLCNYYFSKDINKYTAYLKAKDTPKFIKEMETVIEKHIDTLAGLYGKTSIKYDLNHLYNDCRLTLLNLRYGFEVKIEDLTEKLERNIESECINYFLWISNQAPRKNWSDLTEKELRIIIDEYAGSLAKNENYLYVYRDSVLSYIHLGQKDIDLNRKYFIDKPIFVCELWKNKFKDDPDAFFYYGVLKLINAIHYDNKEMFAQAKDSLEKCREMFTKNPIMQRKFRFNEFLIGKKKAEPLRCLLKYDPNIELKYLNQFEGELSSDGKFLKFQGIRFEHSDSFALNENSKITSVEKGHGNIYKFHIGIRRSGLIAFKFSLKE